MQEAFSRSVMLLGQAAMEALAASRVAVFGLGGVGGAAAEALARAGVGHFDLFDGDSVAISNLNRQIIALHSTLGQPKAEVMCRRVLDINPLADVRANVVFYTPANADSVDLAAYDYILDCVDMVTAKLELAVRVHKLGVPLISAMGAGNKLDPAQLMISDISQTSVCPLARVMRKELKARGIEHLTVAWSGETPRRPQVAADISEVALPGRRALPGSLPFVPAAMGLLMSSHVVRELCRTHSVE